MTTVYRHSEIGVFRGIAVGANGYLYVTLGDAVCRIAPDGGFTTIAGDIQKSGWIDGPGGAARFFAPAGLAIDDGGRIFVADYRNAAIRMIAPAGLVSTAANLSNLSRPRNPSEILVIGGVDYEDFHGPRQIAFTATGDLLVMDLVEDAMGYGPFQYGVWKLAKGTSATEWMAPTLLLPYGTDDERAMTTDRAGNLYVTSLKSRLITRVSAAQMAGEQSVIPQQFEGPDLGRRFIYPRECVVDSSGNIYIVETHDSVIRQGIALIGGESDARIANISVRGTLVRDEPIGVSYFPSGSALVRGIGPGLRPFLPDARPPRDLLLALNSRAASPPFNGNWDDFPPLEAAHVTSGAFLLAVGDVAALSNGPISVQLATTGTQPAAAMLEWYDLAPQTSDPLEHVFVRSTDHGHGIVLGIVIAGTQRKALLLQAHTESENRMFDLAGMVGAVHLAMYDSTGRRLSASADSSPDVTPLLTRLGALLPGSAGKTVLAVVVPPGAYALHAIRQLPLPGEITLELFVLR